MYGEEDYLMLSGIQHFAFCRRQWAGVDGRLCRAEDRYELLFAQRCILGEGQRKRIRYCKEILT